MPRFVKNSRPPKPLDAAKLRDLALHYVGRYATSKAKLTAYLTRKLRERGWADDDLTPDVDAIIVDFDRLGYVDDAAFATSRARSLTQRGFGLRRVAEDLRAKGISEADSSEARDDSETDAWKSADRFAQRKRVGPYAMELAPPDVRQKQLQAFLRAGHRFEVAKTFVFASPGEKIEFPE